MGSVASTKKRWVRTGDVRPSAVWLKTTMVWDPVASGPTWWDEGQMLRPLPSSEHRKLLGKPAGSVPRKKNPRKVCLVDVGSVPVKATVGVPAFTHQARRYVVPVSAPVAVQVLRDGEEPFVNPASVPPLRIRVPRDR